MLSLQLYIPSDIVKVHEALWIRKFSHQYFVGSSKYEFQDDMENQKYFVNSTMYFMCTELYRFVQLVEASRQQDQISWINYF